MKGCYTRYSRKYFPEDVLPEFESLDFQFEKTKDELGSIEWDSNGIPSFFLEESLRYFPTFLRSTILHEMIHIKLGPNKGHGKVFYDEAMRVAALGGIRVWA